MCKIISAAHTEGLSEKAVFFTMCVYVFCNGPLSKSLWKYLKISVIIQDDKV